MRIVFMGTPEFAETALRAIHAAYPDSIVGVVSRVDTPKNRGHAMTPPPVKKAALELGLLVYQPLNLKKENFEETLKEWNPDIIVVAAYGKILPKYVLDFPKYGCINIHASILPRYRGAAPIQRAIMAGETEIGVTIMQMAEGLDTGDMLAKASFPITSADVYGTIHDRLAEIGGSLCVETMASIVNGTAVAEKQDDTLSTYAAKIEKADRTLDLTKTTAEIVNTVRAFSPAPGAEAKLPSGKVKLTVVSALDEAPTGEPGTVAYLSPKGQGKLVVNTVDGKLSIERLIPEGKKEMSAGDFIRGRRITETDRFEITGETV
ncbi:MAG: methionyl-tRNA formyltransferase [Clostridia bacterium]|nr:methionyl-tRNA formyltransferase [Clostridia bacterium]